MSLYTVVYGLIARRSSGTYTWSANLSLLPAKNSKLVTFAKRYQEKTDVTNNHL